MWLALGLIISLLLALVLAAWIAWSREPAAAQGFLAAQGAVEAAVTGRAGSCCDA